MNSSPKQSEHDSQMNLVRDRFTRTANAFADYVLSQRGFEAEHLLQLVAPNGTERALDVACGPGTLSRIFGPHVRWIGGFDLTPAMLERARKETASLNLQNFEAVRGNVLQMPFRDESFDLVVTSYSIHHIPDAVTTIREIARILKRGGKFGLLDMIVSEDPAVAKACNDLEITRDPSHTRALSASEFDKLLSSAGLRILRREIAEHPRAFDTWMRTAGWKRGDAEYEATRKLLEDSIPRDSAGLHVKLLDKLPDGATDTRPDIELIHTALYLAAEKR
ncbi:MAG TPA: class I SAM-dependent methyltransferase [Candidatus Acidoferrales bacterium]|nr:class I SAM-dependent methyltransferase [Candidatus Acidoferrales bacterium]